MLKFFTPLIFINKFYELEQTLLIKLRKKAIIIVTKSLFEEKIGDICILNP